MSLTDKILNRTFPQKDVTLCLDAGLAVEREQIVTELAKARADTRLAGNTAKVQKLIADIESRMTESLVTLRITGLPFAEYNKALQANPPRKGRNEDFNASTFFLYVARRSAKLVEGDTLSDISAEEWDALESALTDGEHDAIASAVIEVNRTKTGNAFLGRVSGVNRSSSETSEPQETSE